MRTEILKLVENEKIIAIVRGIQPEKCVSVAEALYKGGVHMMEITFDQSKPDALENTTASIASVIRKFGKDIRVGAGTVMSAEQVQMAAKAVTAGACIHAWGTDSHRGCLRTRMRCRFCQNISIRKFRPRLYQSIKGSFESY